MPADTDDNATVVMRSPGDAVAGVAGRASDEVRTVTRRSEVRDVLADDSFQVAEVAEEWPFGTVGWLRGSVSRFSNGAAHQERLDHVMAALRSLDSEQLRARARLRTERALASAAPIVGGRATASIDVMPLARRIPMATLADALGASDASAAAGAAIAVAAGYFPGSAARTRPYADAGTARLVELFGPADQQLIVAKIALLVQGCDATAGLIGNAVQLFGGRDATAVDRGRGGDTCSAAPGDVRHTDGLLADTLRLRSPVRQIRRVAQTRVRISGTPVAAGQQVVCDVDAANLDDEVGGPSTLAFGYGIRPCPGHAEAFALAAGVLDAILARCMPVAAPDQHGVVAAPAGPLRIPERVEVTYR